MIKFMSILILGLALWSISNVVHAQDDFNLTTSGISALENKNSKVAYSKFIQTFQIVSPHPDINIEEFIQRANKGESDSFALIAFYVWSGAANFHSNKIAGKLALIRSMSDGSPQAPFWIAQTFFRSDPNSSNSEKIDYFISGVQWLGISSGMGESRSHDEAMELIEEITNGDQKLKSDLMAMYNIGLEESKKYKKQPIKK